jgi:hypothetical protein
MFQAIKGLISNNQKQIPMLRNQQLITHMLHLQLSKSQKNLITLMLLNSNQRAIHMPLQSKRSLSQILTLQKKTLQREKRKVLSKR